MKLHFFVLSCLLFASQLILAQQNHIILLPTDGTAYWRGDTVHVQVNQNFVSPYYFVRITRENAVVLDTISKEKKFSWLLPDSLQYGLYTLLVQDSAEQHSQTIDISISRNSYIRYHYEWQNLTWNANFSPRDGAGLLKFKDKYWLLGGWNSDDNPTTNSQIYSSEDMREWHYETDAPWEGRHVAGWIIFKEAIWVVGGDNNRGHYIHDLWKSHDGLHWEQVLDSIPIPRRVLHIVSSFNDRIYIIGGEQLPLWGMSDDTHFADVWSSSNGVDWILEHHEAPFRERGMVIGNPVFNDTLWVIGGGQYHPRIYHNDVWKSADGFNWTQVVEAAEFPPRQYHHVSSFDNKLWITGGLNLTLGGDLNDVWYSDNGKEWHELADTPWYPRHAHSVFADDRSMILLGGPLFMSDVWELYRAIDSVDLNIKLDTLYVVSPSNHELYTSKISGFSYEWLKDGQIYRTSNRLIVPDYGRYQLKVTDLSGREAYSNTISVLPMDFDVMNKTVVLFQNDSLFPTDILNPALLSSSHTSINLYTLNDMPFQGLVEGDTVIRATISIENATFTDTVSIIALKPQVALDGDNLLFPGERLFAYVQKVHGYNYKWFKDRSVLTSSRENKIQITASGNYVVEISRRAKTIYSSDTIHVLADDFDVELNSDTAVFEGNLLNIRSVDTRPYQYYWFKNDTLIAEGGSLTLNSPGEYYYRIYRDVEKVFESRKILITVYRPRVTILGDTILFRNDSVKLAVPHLPGYNYQWERNGIPLRSETSSAIWTSRVGKYQCKIHKDDNYVTMSRIVTVENRIIHYPLPDLLTLLPQDTVKLSVTHFEDIYYEWSIDNKKLCEGFGMSSIKLFKGGQYSLNVFKTPPVVSNTSLSQGRHIGATTVQIESIPSVPKRITYVKGKPYIFNFPDYYNSTFKVYKGGAFTSTGTGKISIRDEGLYTFVIEGNVHQVTVADVYLTFEAFVLERIGSPESFSIFTIKGPAFSDLSYKWYRNGQIIADDNHATFETDEKGEYYAEITFPDQSILRSNSISLDTVDDEYVISIATNLITLVCKSEYKGDYEAIVLDPLGKQLASVEGTKKENKDVIDLPISLRQNNLYIVIYKTKARTIVRKVRLT